MNTEYRIENIKKRKEGEKLRFSILHYSLFFGVLATLFPIAAIASTGIARSNTTALSNGLVGYWTLDGSATNWATGQTYDASGQGNTGQLISMNTTTSPVIGKIGGALNFNGTTNYINAGTGSSLQPSLPITISVWIKPTAISGAGNGIIKAGSSTTNHSGWEMHVDPDGTIGLEFGSNGVCNSTSRRSKASTATLSLNVWTHVVGVIRGATDMSIYFNGVDAGGSYSGSGGALAYDGSGLNIGNITSCAGTTNPFQGTIDDVRVYNRALSTQEVQQLYAQGKLNVAHSNTVTLATGLVGYWTLDGGATNWVTGQTYDASGQGNTGQLIKMSTSTSPAIGKIGGALTFNGTTQGVEAFSLTTAPLMQGPLTISAWLNPASSAEITAFCLVLSDSGSAGQLACMEDLSNGHFGVVEWGDSTVIDSNVTPSLRTWYHIVYTVDGSNHSKVYVNGVLKNTSSTATNTGTAGIACIGCINAAFPTTRTWNGKIDDVRVYNRSLSAQEVQQLYAQGKLNVAHSNTVTLATGLVGYWSLDGGATNWATGQTYDVSGQGNTGQLFSMSTSTSPAVGKIGQALNFNGTRDVEINDASSLRVGSGDFTLSAWVLNTSTDAFGNHYAIVKGFNASGDYGLGIRNSENAYEIFSGGTSIKVTPPNPANNATPNKWQFLTEVKSGSIVSVYQNGVFAGSATVTGQDSGNGLTIGSWGARAQINPWQGKLDDVRVYNRALSAQEVWQLYSMSK